MPKQILDMRPYFSRCVDNFFTGFDPPRTLAPAAALAPSTTTTSSVASTISPKPSPTLDVGAKKTAKNEPPMNTPSKIPAVGQPRKQDTQAPDPKHQISDPGKESHDLAPPENHPAQPGSKSKEINGDPQQGDKANIIPAEGKNPAPPSDPVPPAAAGIAKAGSNQNTDPASNYIPPLVENADPVDVEATDRHIHVQPNDPYHISNAAESVADTGGNNPSEVHPLPEAIHPEENSFSEFSPTDETEGGVLNVDPKKSDQPNKAIEDPGNDDLSLITHPGKYSPAEEITGESRPENLSPSEPSIKGLQDPGVETASELDSIKEPGTENPSKPHSSFEITDDTRHKNPSKIDPSVEVTGGYQVENPSEANLPIKGAQDPGMENTDESDLVHEMMENPETGAPSRPRPTGNVMKYDENDPSNPYPTIGGTGKESPGELDILDTVEDSTKEFTNNLDPSYGTMDDAGRDHSSDLYSSVVYPGSENLSALGHLLDTAEDPEKAYLDKLNHPFENTGESKKDTSSNSNPSVKFPAEESHSSPNQSSTSNNHITTPNLASSKFRTALPLNGTLNTPNTTTNITMSTTTPLSPTRAGVTIESGLDFPPPATRTESPVSSNDHANAASDVEAMDSGAWMALGVLMVWVGV